MRRGCSVLSCAAPSNSRNHYRKRRIQITKKEKRKSFSAFPFPQKDGDSMEKRRSHLMIPCEKRRIAKKELKEKNRSGIERGILHVLTTLPSKPLRDPLTLLEHPSQSISTIKTTVVRPPFSSPSPFLLLFFCTNHKIARRLYQSQDGHKPKE